MNIPNELKKLISFIDLHNSWRDKTINLIPSENITSKYVREILGSDLGHRYSLWEPEWRDEDVSNFYLGTKYIDEIYRFGVKIAKKIYEAGYADLRPPSGHISDMALLMTFTQYNDNILVISEEHGGYPGLEADTLPSKLGLNIVYAPYSVEEGNIDIDRLENLLRMTRVDLIFIGSSFIPFIHPIKELGEISVKYGIPFIYDGSHVLGLIAGRRYPNPLKYNAVALCGSTHKTLPGPQGGIILSTEEASEYIRKNIVMYVVDNPHYNRIAALTYTLFEMSKYSEKYATQIIKNSRRLAEELYNRDIPIKYSEKGFTETHQVILDIDKIRNFKLFAKRLEDVGIIIDYGGRIGTQEVTRRGLYEDDMIDIAEAIYNVYNLRNIDKAKEIVKEISKRFKIEYTFKL